MRYAGNRTAVARCLAGLVFLASLGMSAIAAAQPDAAFDKRSNGRFTGQAFVTDNLDWYEMFSRPEVPRVNMKSQFAPGESGSLGIIFSNAEAREGTVRVECDVTALDPEGSRVVVSAGVCYEGPYFGDNILHPALLDLRFRIGADDPPGKSGFKVTLRDAHSRRSVNLQVTFMQGKGK